MDASLIHNAFSGAIWMAECCSRLAWQSEQGRDHRKMSFFPSENYFFPSDISFLT